jgi:hypothetical protein
MFICFVFLNSLVIILVSSPVYVMVAHFCFWWCGEFILHKNFTKLPQDIISKQQKLIRSSINTDNDLISIEQQIRIRSVSLPQNECWH